MQAKGIGTASALLIAALAVGLAPTATADPPLADCATENPPGDPGPGTIGDAMVIVGCQEDHVFACQQQYSELPEEGREQVECILLGQE